MRFSFEDFDFESLSAAERLLLAQELLDSVYDDVSPSTSAKASAAPFTQEQMAEIRHRVAEADASRMMGEPFQIVRDRLQS